MNVKTLTFSLLVLLLFGGSASAAKVGLDVKAGLNLSKFIGKDADIFEFEEEEGVKHPFLPAFSGGLGLRIQIVDMFTIQPELLLSTKGTKYSMEEGDFSGSFSLKSMYLEIPVLLKFNIPASETIYPSIYAAPALGILTSAKAVEKYDDGEDSDEESEDIKDEFKAVDFGLAFGADLGIKVGPGKILLDVRYTLGLTSIWEVPNGFEGDVPDIRNGAISVFAGYGFDF